MLRNPVEGNRGMLAGFENLTARVATMCLSQDAVNLPPSGVLVLGVLNDGRGLPDLMPTSEGREGASSPQVTRIAHAGMMVGQS